VELLVAEAEGTLWDVAAEAVEATSVTVGAASATSALTTGVASGFALDGSHAITVKVAARINVNLVFIFFSWSYYCLSRCGPCFLFIAFEKQCINLSST
jgi:hypothetical protein